MVTVALAIWPFIGAIFFAVLSPARALLATIFAGYLLLPSQGSFDLPLLPELDKDSIPALVSLLAIALIARKPSVKSINKPQSPDRAEMLPGWLPRQPVALFCLICLVFGSFGTVALNGDALRYGPVVLPGLRAYDALSAVLSSIMVVLPFLLARKVLSGPNGQRLLLQAFAVSAAAYALLALYEVRMSPQLSNMVYGFFPHDWIQHWRGTGWRPVVFLNHGLVLSMFFGMGTIAAAILVKAAPAKQRGLWALVGIWLFGTLVLSKSLGPLAITVAMLCIIFAVPRRLQVVVAVCLATLVLLYPTARTANLVPVDLVVSAAQKIDAQRAGSLEIRLENEDRLLAKAKERPVFGWGLWGRSRVIDESGRDVSITDGAWTIIFGVGGWVRYIGVFGLLTLGVIALFWERRSRLDPVTIGLALMLVANLIDLLPNTSLVPLTWLVAGSLVGRLEQVRRATDPETGPDGQDTMEDPLRGPPVYARDFSSSGRLARDVDATAVMERGEKAATYRREFPGDRAGR